MSEQNKSEVQSLKLMTASTVMMGVAYVGYATTGLKGMTMIATAALVLAAVAVCIWHSGESGQ